MASEAAIRPSANPVWPSSRYMNWGRASGICFLDSYMTCSVKHRAAENAAEKGIHPRIVP